MHQLTNDQGDIVCITPTDLNEQQCIDSCRHPQAGAICSFVGTTRDSFQGKQVTQLEYEAYVPLALKTLLAIAVEARLLALQGAFSQPSPIANFSATVTPNTPHAQELKRIVIAHRIGIVPPTQTSIVIVVSCGHRREAFAACEWILESVKKKAEVWKKEWYHDKEEAAVWKENFPQTIGT